MRVIAYVDGFNLYFGLMQKKWRRFLWLNLKVLVQNLLKPYQRLVHTKYFTSRIKGSQAKQKRQSIYIEALETLSDFSIFYGHYQLNPRECGKCGFTDHVPNEKKTDVNIAVEMLSDAFQDKFDMALLISADSDLVPVLKCIKTLFPNKRIVIAFPPKRYSAEIAAEAHAYFTILKHALNLSLFPQQVQTRTGFTLNCPSSWLPPKP